MTCRFLLGVAAAALAMSSAVSADMFTVVELKLRNDYAAGIFALPDGVTEAEVAVVPAFSTGFTFDLNHLANSGDDFEMDMIRVFGGIGGGSDDLRFTITKPFNITIGFLSNDRPANTPAFRLFSGNTAGAPSEAVLTAQPVSVARDTPFQLGGQGPGTYVLQIDGTDDADEAYDVTISSVP